jgi:hypothetical protein
MGKCWKQAIPDYQGLYWVNAGGVIAIAIPLDEERGLFNLWSSDQGLYKQVEWVASRHKPGWFFREEFAENLIFQ